MKQLIDSICEALKLKDLDELKEYIKNNTNCNNSYSFVNTGFYFRYFVLPYNGYSYLIKTRNNLTIYF